MYEISDLQKYRYDLQGFLVVENVLSAEKVAELKALADEHDLSNLPANHRFGRAGGSWHTGPGFLQWGQPFVDLMDHPLVMNMMRHQLGVSFRLDRLFGMHMRRGEEEVTEENRYLTKGIHSDYGASEPFSKAEPGRYFSQPGYQALHGFSVAIWNLTDMGPDTGGLMLIPGSHNGHYKIPDEVRKGAALDIIQIPRIPAGSVAFFSEAVSHGTTRWSGEHHRYSLLYKYCASQLVWSRTRVTEPEGLTLNDRQRQLLAEPAGAEWYFPSLFDAAEAGDDTA